MSGNETVIIQLVSGMSNVNFTTDLSAIVHSVTKKMLCLKLDIQVAVTFLLNFVSILAIQRDKITFSITEPIQPETIRAHGIH